MTSRRREPPVEGSWRLVEGENDSFDTTILHSVSDDDDIVAPQSSGQPSSEFPSQLSSLSQGHMSLGSQDSIRDFSRHQDDDQVILREPFRPSLPGAQSSDKYRSPDPEFKMPFIEVDAVGRDGHRRAQRAPRAAGVRLREENSARLRRKGKGAKNSPSKGRLRLEDEDEDDEESKTIKDRILDSLPAALLEVVIWVLGVFSLAFRYAQKPLALLLAIYVLFGAIIMAQNMVTKSVSASLSPLCRLPGASLLHIPFCPSPLPDMTGENGQSVEFDDLMNTQAKFEQVLEKSAEGVSLPFEMKRSETTIRDLRTLVRNSDIQSREELVLEFDGYIEVARQSASDLQAFNTHCGSAVDAVVAINRWTSRYIDSLDPSSDESSPTLMSSWVSWLFYPFTPSDRAFSERIVLDKYIEHTALVSDRISRLILEAQAVLRLLGRAEDHLTLIYDISSRSSASVVSRRDQVFWNLWTLVGANNARLHNLSQQLSLLKQVDVQRSSAIAQVNALILELESIQASLGDLRDRVAEPELLRDPATRAAPIPLSVHIETIDRGVERLESARRRIRAAEDDRVREALRKGGVKDEQLIEGR